MKYYYAFTRNVKTKYTRDYFQIVHYYLLNIYNDHIYHFYNV